MMIAVNVKQKNEWCLPHKLTTTINSVEWYRRTKNFGYMSEIIQPENGGEFDHMQKTKRLHLLDVLYKKLHIVHKTIRSVTLRHNSEVEHSHSKDRAWLYNHLSFFLTRICGLK